MPSKNVRSSSNGQAGAVRDLPGQIPDAGVGDEEVIAAYDAALAPATLFVGVGDADGVARAIHAVGRLEPPLLDGGVRAGFRLRIEERSGVVMRDRVLLGVDMRLRLLAALPLVIPLVDAVLR